MMGLVGLGLLYVGRMRLMIILMLSGLAVLLTLSWTRWILEPIGYFFLVGAAAIALVLSLFFPAYVAWKEKSAPVKFYNRWYFYLGWFLATTLFAEILLPTLREHVLGYDSFRTPARSMLQTLAPGDLFTVDTWRYEKQSPTAGDVVVFRTPEGYTFVKRIVGTPGDRIEIHSGVVHRNGRAILEPYTYREPSDTPYGRDAPSITLGISQYYVLGDYRDQSKDSRNYGPIDESQLIGRVESIVFSFWDGSIHPSRFPLRLTDDT